MKRYAFPQSRQWFERAERVIPGGIYGHQSPSALTMGEFPFFLDEASGCRVRDCDGNEYIDFLCAYGPMVVGYANPRVEAAAQEQRTRCDSGDLPSTIMVTLAERLVALTTGMDWCMFAKNGSDVSTWALALARQATGRARVATVAGTYHGVHGWCNNRHSGFPDSDRDGVSTFQWNDTEGVSRLMQDGGDELAAVMVTPFRHEAFADSVLPAEGFLTTLRALTQQHGVVLIVDDVRAGFRLDMAGSTQRWGVTPDLLLYSKALANGYPLAALLGCEQLRAAAQEVFVTGTFFTQAVPMAASLACLQELEDRDGIAHMQRVGTRLCQGLSRQALAAGLTVTVSGPPAVPFLTFDADAGSFDRSRTFAGACVASGVFVHPVHNWFLSLAHSEEDIDSALLATETAFNAVRRKHGADL